MKRKHNTLPGKKLMEPYILVLTIWVLYRAFFSTSIWIEELVIKGLVFGLPIVLLPLATKSQLVSLGITTKNIYRGTMVGIGIGILLGLAGCLGNIIRHGAWTVVNDRISAGMIGAFIILSLVTAFWEQLLFSGYFVSKFQEKIKDERVIVGMVGLLFAMIHLPIYILVQKMPPEQLVLSGILLLGLGAGCVILRLRHQSIIAPIMAHALWGITVFLFR